MQRKTCFFKITFCHGDHLLFIENNENLFVISLLMTESIQCSEEKKKVYQYQVLF